VLRRRLQQNQRTNTQGISRPMASTDLRMVSPSLASKSEKLVDAALEM